MLQFIAVGASYLPPSAQTQLWHGPYVVTQHSDGL